MYLENRDGEVDTKYNAQMEGRGRGRTSRLDGGRNSAAFKDGHPTQRAVSRLCRKMIENPYRITHTD